VGGGVVSGPVIRGVPCSGKMELSVVHAGASWWVDVLDQKSPLDKL
jgi:hypothetical protein